MEPTLQALNSYLLGSHSIIARMTQLATASKMNSRAVMSLDRHSNPSYSDLEVTDKLRSHSAAKAELNRAGFAGDRLV